MASQYLSVAKIAGEASTETLRQFQEWSALRTCTNPCDWNPDQWPESARSAADNWAERLRAHGHEPPIIFFAEYVDLWSFCPPARFLEDHGLIGVLADRYELFCLPLPLTSTATTELERLKTSGQWDEDRLFAGLTLDAADSWNKLVDQAVLVFLRLAVSGAVEDQEVLDSLTGLPDWMKGGYTCQTHGAGYQTPDQLTISTRPIGHVDPQAEVEEGTVGRANSGTRRKSARQPWQPREERKLTMAPDRNRRVRRPGRWGRRGSGV
jgi:hypothetical protein